MEGTFIKREFNDREKAIELILKESIRERSMVLGIDGLSRSGKSTFSQMLAEIYKENSIPYEIIHMDDHIVPKERRYQTGYEEWYEYYSLQWDVSYLKKNLFNRLKVADRIELDSVNQSVTYKIPRPGIVVIEGVFLQRPEWKGSFDKLIYLDCPKEKRFARESEEARKNISKFQMRYWKAEDYYLNHISPLEKADWIIRQY
ncbi:kinase [Halobacillus yeomjeoni]|uniref:Uridine kinase n=1 Tax=Halobacillus yeomjeoni TaxID=311194 RepID=A0A931HTM8_9BACI|nr:kinase [Halobacillus yeomjeoni]MBH0229203.1 hypothetical protein [Halobacillus yeomjeoni]